MNALGLYIPATSPLVISNEVDVSAVRLAALSNPSLEALRPKMYRIDPLPLTIIITSCNMSSCDMSLKMLSR